MTHKFSHIFASFSEASSVLYHLYEPTHSTESIQNCKKGMCFLCCSFAYLLSESSPSFFSSAYTSGSAFPRVSWQVASGEFWQMGSVTGLLGSGEEKQPGYFALSLLWRHPWPLCFLYSTSYQGTVIPMYFWSHKIATKRFQLLLDGLASEHWQPSVLPTLHPPNGASSFLLLFLTPGLPHYLLIWLPSSSIPLPL